MQITKWEIRYLRLKHRNHRYEVDKNIVKMEMVPMNHHGEVSEAPHSWRNSSKHQTECIHACCANTGPETMTRKNPDFDM